MSELDLDKIEALCEAARVERERLHGIIEEFIYTESPVDQDEPGAHSIRGDDPIQQIQRVVPALVARVRELEEEKSELYTLVAENLDKLTDSAKFGSRMRSERDNALAKARELREHSAMLAEQLDKAILNLGDRDLQIQKLERENDALAKMAPAESWIADRELTPEEYEYGAQVPILDEAKKALK